MDSTLNNIEEYYEEVKEIYGIEFKQFKDICLSPFLLVKEVISGGSLKNIRLQYFAVFEASASRIKYSKKTLEENFAKGVISEERYNRRIKILNNYEV